MAVICKQTDDIQTDFQKGGKGVVSEKKISIGKSDVHYLEAGSAGGQEILLLHGKNFKSATWLETGTIEILEASGFHVFAVDLPGFGLSPANETGKPETLKAIIKALCLTTPVVVAPSMSGGYLLPVAADGNPPLKAFVAVAPVEIPEHVERLKGNTLPVLVIWGSDDQVVPLEHADIICEAMPNSEKVEIENGGHPTYLTNTDIFHSYLMGFLESL